MRRDGPRDWRRRVDGANPTVDRAGVSIDLPYGWTVVPRVTTPVSDPLERLAISATPATIDPDQSTCVTEASTRVFDDGGAMVLVMEYTSDLPPPVASYPPRPARFGPDVPAPGGSRVPAGGFECFDGSGGVFQFTDHGRRFLAWVLLGTRAGPGVEATALDALTSLTVAPR
jgi:hypothetical protein